MRLVCNTSTIRSTRIENESVPTEIEWANITVSVTNSDQSFSTLTASFPRGSQQIEILKPTVESDPGGHMHSVGSLEPIPLPLPNLHPPYQGCPAHLRPSSGLKMESRQKRNYDASTSSEHQSPHFPSLHRSPA